VHLLSRKAHNLTARELVIKLYNALALPRPCLRLGGCAPAAAGSALASRGPWRGGERSCTRGCDAALVQNPYGSEALGYTEQKGGFLPPVSPKTGEVYGGVVVTNNAVSAVGGLFAAVVAMVAGLAEATKPSGDEGCLISPTGAPGPL